MALFHSVKCSHCVLDKLLCSIIVAKAKWYSSIRSLEESSKKTSFHANTEPLWPLRLRDSVERPGIIFSPMLPQASIPWMPMWSWRASRDTAQATPQLPVEDGVGVMTHVRKTDRFPRPPLGLLAPFVKTGFCGRHLTNSSDGDEVPLLHSPHLRWRQSLHPRERNEQNWNSMSKLEGEMMLGNTDIFTWFCERDTCWVLRKLADTQEAHMQAFSLSINSNNEI